MKTLMWKLRYAMIFRSVVKSSIALAWQSACAWEESFGMEYTPWDAVHEEISCWEAA